MFFAGSVKTFQAAAVEPGAAEPEAVGSGVAPGEALPADGSAGVVLPPGLAPAVQAGEPFPSVPHPESAAAVTASAAAIRTPRDMFPEKIPVPVLVPVMVPA